MSQQAFENRTALVTGGSRGIGRAVCENLAAGGARVAINFQTNEQAAHEALAAVEKNAEKAMIVQADVSREDHVERMVAEVREKLGPIDLLVNNAGIAESVVHDQLSFESWKRMFEVNVDGPFLVTWAVKDEMIKRRFGRIVNVSSLAGLVRKKEMIHYATTKAAVNSFTRHCALAFAPYNVRVNCVAPGLTNTRLSLSANPDVPHLIGLTALGRMAEPSEIADVVRFLLSEESSFITGQTVSACGGRV